MVGSSVTGNLLTALAALCAVLILPVECQPKSNILVVPMDGSHWVNMAVILKELHYIGHNLTVIRSRTTFYIPENSSFYTSITVPGIEDEFDMAFYDKLLRRHLEFRRSGRLLRTLYIQWELGSLMSNGIDYMARTIGLMFEDQEVMSMIRDTKFDMVFADPAMPTGIFLAHYFKLTIVYNVRWILMGDSHFTFAPSPLSYVPVTGSELTDQMDFSERFLNMVIHIIQCWQFRFLVEPAYGPLIERYFPPGTDLLSMVLSVDLWFVRGDFVFEFPRPTMPNVVYIGGFQCRPSKPLPDDLEAFVQSSGEHGIVIMSLGTLIAALPKEVTEAIAMVFAEMPHKVIWRYIGERPSTLGNNTLLVDWFPQNDLLGHPKTRVFVAHGGTNGVYESIYHGVPILGLPLLFDQFDNLLRLQARGAARVLEASSLTSANFKEALLDVLENPSYKEAMQRLSRLHRDNEMHPLDRAIFWIEYVLRNKGAGPLRAEGDRLPWYVYHSVDVGLFLLTVLVVSVWLFFKFCKMVLRRICGRKAKVE
ncbi:UDP-glucuronosyltransferase 2C1-like [Engraulis encrasicolus]|uniref:UDP-glucuronosyltransferase 2C1-like n=1 Tax=Engraulis encrasicolus TaxID=184585 RepID=UPI002FCEFFFC